MLGKGSLFINSISKTGCYVQMNQIGLFSHNIQKMNLKLIKDLNVKPEVIKLLKNIYVL